MTTGTGTLFVVATPIGNLQDISPRALEVLRSVALIAAEDTRHSARLMQHFGIGTPMTACHDHNERDKGERLVAHLVRQAREAGVRVSPLPGACALIAALSAAGLPSDRFAFEGFLPAKSHGRRQRLQALADESRTWMVYEAPHRLLECLDDMCEILGAERRVVLARELTKTFETLRSAPIAELADWVRGDSDQQRGECVLVVEGASVAESEEVSGETLRVLDALLQELPVKQAARLAAQITGERKNQLYQLALDRGTKNA